MKKLLFSVFLKTCRKFFFVLKRSPAELMETFLFNCFYISDLLWSTLLVTVVAFLALSLSNTKPHTLFLSLSNSTPYTIFLYNYPDALTHTRTHSLTRLHVWLKITPEKHLLEWESECRWVSERERVDLQIKVREVPWIMQPPHPLPTLLLNVSYSFSSVSPSILSCCDLFFSILLLSFDLRDSSIIFPHF